MQCEVCFKPCNGRRCKKHPEYHPEAFHLKALKEDPAYRLECRLIDMEGQITPSLCQDTTSSLLLPDNGESEKRVVRGGSEMGVAFLPLAATPTQFQQIKGELNYLMNRLNEHIDRSKKKSKF